MTIPGLALFYSGMVRKKNVLATMAQSLAAVTLISILWVAFGYSLCFVGDGPWIGTLDRWFLDMRCRTLDLAAALDRLDRARGSDDLKADPRMARLRKAVAALAEQGPGRAEKIQLLFSREYDPSWMKKQG